VYLTLIVFIFFLTLLDRFVRKKKMQGREVELNNNRCIELTHVQQIYSTHAYSSYFFKYICRYVCMYILAYG
jgi:hypothetical protein